MRFCWFEITRAKASVFFNVLYCNAAEVSHSGEGDIVFFVYVPY